MQPIIPYIGPSARLGRLRENGRIGRDACRPVIDQYFFRGRRKPRGVSRFERNVTDEASAKRREKSVGDAQLEVQTWWELNQQDCKLPTETGDLVQKRVEGRSRVGQATRVGDLLRDFCCE